MYKKKVKQSKSTIKEKLYRFWINNIEYGCKIIAPIELPDYKLKEVFIKSVIAKKEKQLSLVPLLFKELHQDIDCSIMPIKEIENVK